VEHARLGDDELAGLAAQGDERAFEELYRRHERALHRYCRSILHDDEDASDAVQNAMLGAVRALPSRTRDTGVRAWLYAIARNESITLLRRRRPTAGEEAALLVPFPAADAIALQREQAAQLVADLGTLSERQRGALVMRELADASYEEIARLHNTSEHAVRQSVTEARTALREIAAGRDASCATIRPALHDRRRRSRAVRAHLKSCHDCQAIASPVPSRHIVWGPLVAMWFALRRTFGVVAADGNTPGWIAGLTQSGAAKPAAAAGVAIVAALSAVPLTDERPNADSGAKPKTEQRAEKKAEPAPKPAATAAAKPAGATGSAADGGATVRTAAAGSAKTGATRSDDAGDVPKSRAGDKVARSTAPSNDDDGDRRSDEDSSSGSGDDDSSGRRDDRNDNDGGGGGGGRHDDGDNDWGGGRGGHDSDWGDGGGGRGGHHGGGGGSAESASVREDCPEPQAEAAPEPPAEAPPADQPAEPAA
jgi:RNA polymerase sigma-70 factor (ECF subfamily)